MSTDDLIPSDALVDELGIGGGDFRAIGERFVSRFITKGWVEPHHTVVDVGCGLGRMARPFTEFLSADGRFVGFDINKRSIEWCSQHYVRFPNFSFHHVDAKSDFYNPKGQHDVANVRFALPDESVDFINMASVFTHLLPNDVGPYLREVARLLRHGGRCSITYFLLDPLVAEVIDRGEVGPSPARDLGILNVEVHAIEGGYVFSREKPEAVVLLEESLVRRGYEEANLQITSAEYGFWCGEARGPYRPISGKWFQDTIDATKT